MDATRVPAGDDQVILYVKVARRDGSDGDGLLAEAFDRPT